MTYNINVLGTGEAVENEDEHSAFEKKQFETAKEMVSRLDGVISASFTGNTLSGSLKE